jgi:hypothetical protein
MRYALAYLDEQKAACKGKNSPKGINFIHKVMSMLSRQKDIQYNQYAQEYKKGNFKLGGSFSQIFYDVQNIHYKTSYLPLPLIARLSQRQSPVLTETSSLSRIPKTISQ